MKFVIEVVYKRNDYICMSEAFE